MHKDAWLHIVLCSTATTERGQLFESGILYSIMLGAEPICRVVCHLSPESLIYHFCCQRKAGMNSSGAWISENRCRQSYSALRLAWSQVSNVPPRRLCSARQRLREEFFTARGPGSIGGQTYATRPIMYMRNHVSAQTRLR